MCAKKKERKGAEGLRGLEWKEELRLNEQEEGLNGRGIFGPSKEQMTKPLNTDCLF